MPAARWTETAVDLSESPAKVANYLGLTAVCAQVNLAPATVEDSLLRPAIDDPANPRGAICRPAARIGGTLKPTPLWHPRQVAEYKARVKARKIARGTRRKAHAKLDEISAAAALGAGLALVDEIAERLELADNTVRRYARDYAATFPPVVAIAPREGERHYGPPREYRNFADVAKWIAAHQAEADRGRAAALSA